MKVTIWDGRPIAEPGIYRGVPIEVYHGADLCVGPSISSSGLRTIFNDSPMAYWVESPYNPLRLVPEDKEAFILGRAAHHLILGETDFGRHFTVEPTAYTDDKGAIKPWNNNATFCLEWRKHVIEGDGLTVLTNKQIESIRGMAGVLPWQKNLEDSGLANSALVRAGALSGLVEHSIIARDEATGVWLKSRPDAIPLDSTEFADFKTTVAVDAAALERTLGDFRYDMQAVLASICLQGAIGQAFTSFAFIFAMKKPPHAVEVVELQPIDLADAELDLRAAIDTFARCMATGRWPGPSGGRGDARYIQRTDWSRKEAAGRRALLEMELET